jgi:hypothetical protein
MTDSDFWRELAEEFRLLRDNHGELRADRTRGRDSGLVEWTLTGGDRSARIQFEALAKRGALLVPDAHSSGLLGAWLEALRHASASSRGDESEGADDHRSGTGCLCTASADYCNQEESRALDAEFQQRQQEDPKNGSPLSRKWAAHKQIRQLMRGPHEEIPESFVRNVLGEQYGIAPEKVTAKQIRFEVSDLLRQYPAIRLGHDEPIEATPSADDANPPEIAPVRRESVGEQIDRYREESRLPVEALAEAIKANIRTVERHIADEGTPALRHLGGYERVFSRALKRRIVINKMP